MKKLIIHDLDEQEYNSYVQGYDSDTIVISDNGTIHNCIGCFGCWLKTPGRCVLKDGYQNMGELLSKCEELIIISKCIYGSYSPFIRNVFDRCIPYLLPYFTNKNGRTRHKKRYKNKFILTVHFYGDDITNKEQETAKALVEANGINFYSSRNKVCFYNNPQSLKGVLQ